VYVWVCVDVPPVDPDVEEAIGNLSSKLAYLVYPDAGKDSKRKILSCGTTERLESSGEQSIIVLYGGREDSELVVPEAEPVVPLDPVIVCV
jgi:hypothetical protein